MSGRTASRSCCGLTAKTMSEALAAASSRASIARRPGKRWPRLTRCAASGSTTWISFAGVPREINPPTSAAAMLPPPINVMLIASLASLRSRPSWHGAGPPTPPTDGTPTLIPTGCPLSVHAGFRVPKMALPTRTMVAPSAMAASRSPDIPIDSVSRAKPLARQRSRHRRATAN